MRDFMINLVLTLPEQLKDTPNSSHLLTKLNSTLISIVKLEWGNSFHNFIPDICSSAQDSVHKCMNALNILKLLSEEVFDFSKGSMLKSQVTQFKQQFYNQFQQIYQLCMSVLNASFESIPMDLFKACLRTLQVYLGWIPLNFIFNENLAETLIGKFI